MTSLIDKEDWTELVGMLVQAERSVSEMEPGNESPEKCKASQESLKSFHVTAAMLGLPELERAGIELEQYLDREIKQSGNRDALTAFSFAINALMEGMEASNNGSNAAALNMGEVLEILGVDEPAFSGDVLSDEEIPSEEPVAPLASEPSPPADAPIAEPASASEPADLSRLEQIVAKLGGQVSMTPGNGSFSLSFPVSPAAVKELEALLSSGDPMELLEPSMFPQEGRIEKVLSTIKEFMEALSGRNIARAQGILLQLADQQYQAGLYKEIGSMARELHTSLKTFMDVMDPSLREMVEDKLPDSGSRLEHMLELTEKAANTTIDNVEKLQKRNHEEQKRLALLYENFGKLQAIGEQAGKRLAENQNLLTELEESLKKNHDDLIVVLTAQDYQDLTGQIIQKITQLLKELELKLVNVIRTFGVKVDTGKKAPEPEELYGPAHKDKEEALHSQDDVDSLLAEFGF